jgi:hypothetical protein
MTLKDALTIAVKVLSKTLDTTKLTTDKGMDSNYLTLNTVNYLKTL